MKITVFALILALVSPCFTYLSVSDFHSDFLFMAGPICAVIAFIVSLFAPCKSAKLKIVISAVSGSIVLLFLFFLVIARGSGI